MFLRSEKHHHRCHGIRRRRKTGRARPRCVGEHELIDPQFGRVIWRIFDRCRLRVEYRSDYLLICSSRTHRCAEIFDFLAAHEELLLEWKQRTESQIRIGNHNESEVKRYRELCREKILYFLLHDPRVPEDARGIPFSVRDQKTRWGSCSSRKRMNFNYRLYFLPDDLFGYVILHEAAHLREMNHGSAFWKLVSEMEPRARALDHELKKYGIAENRKGANEELTPKPKPRQRRATKHCAYAGRSYDTLPRLRFLQLLRAHRELESCAFLSWNAEELPELAEEYRGKA